MYINQEQHNGLKDLPRFFSNWLQINRNVSFEIDVNLYYLEVCVHAVELDLSSNIYYGFNNLLSHANDKLPHRSRFY